MREFTRIGWHLGGMSYTEYMGLTMRETWYLHQALDEIIELTDGSLPMRPRDWRK